jgi:hypothetical protein
VYYRRGHYALGIGLRRETAALRPIRHENRGMQGGEITTA